jgi:hypothetical protein
MLCDPGLPAIWQACLGQGYVFRLFPDFWTRKYVTITLSDTGFFTITVSDS